MTYFIIKLFQGLIAIIALEMALISIGKLTGSNWRSRNFATGIAFKTALILDGYFTVMLCQRLLYSE